MIMKHEGFTLFECLIALLVLSGLLIFLTPLVKEINKWWEFQAESSYIEMHIGKKQLEYEINSLEFVEIKNNRLIYQKKEPDKETVIFEYYEGMLRKTPGFQPIMTNIQTITFDEKNQVIKMEVVTKNEEEYVYFFEK